MQSKEETSCKRKTNELRWWCHLLRSRSDEWILGVSCSVLRASWLFLFARPDNDAFMTLFMGFPLNNQWIDVTLGLHETRHHIITLWDPSSKKILLESLVMEFTPDSRWDDDDANDGTPSRLVFRCLLSSSREEDFLDENEKDDDDDVDEGIKAWWTTSLFEAPNAPFLSTVPLDLKSEVTSWLRFS